MQLSPHFTLEELTRSQTATRLGLANVPSPIVVDNLKLTAARLEQVRTALGGKPILIDSGFRSIAVNARVGSQSTSAHCKGLAVDFICPEFGSPLSICMAIMAAGIVFEQLIFEGTWVHLAVSPAGQTVARNEVLTAVFKSGAPTRYLKGLVI